MANSVEPTNNPCQCCDGTGKCEGYRCGACDGTGKGKGMPMPMPAPAPMK